MSPRGKIRRKAFSRRTNRSISLRFRSSRRSEAQGAPRGRCGGTTGGNPPSRASGRGAAASAARSMSSGRPAAAPRGHQEPARGIRPASGLSGPPRQPDAGWWSRRPGMDRWPAGRFFHRPGASGMDLPPRAGQRAGLKGAADELFPVPLRENSIQAPALGPTGQAGGDWGPPCRTEPAAPAPGPRARPQTEWGLEPLAGGAAHGAPLDRQTGGAARVVGFISSPHASHPVPL